MHIGNSGFCVAASGRGGAAADARRRVGAGAAAK